MRFIPTRLIYSFSIQLVVMHIKKNQLMIIYWLILFGFITQSFSKRFGIPYLFLDPEYLGKVNILSFFIVGLACGVFIMAFNISSYILNSFRFPFLACLSKAFHKYTLNNFIIPTLFLLVYIFEIFHFQYFNQFKSIPEILLYIFGFLSGIFIVISLTMRYFHLTNKDIYKLFGVQHADESHKLSAVPVAQANGNVKKRRRKKKMKGDKTWRVETYFVMPLHTRLVRNTEHYKEYMLQSVFKQNHINAAVIELLIFSAFIILGLFREREIFQIPAAASVMLLITMFVMLSGVLRYWLKSWASTAVIVLFIVLNYFSQFEFFNIRNKAFGLDYTRDKKEYSMESISDAVSAPNIWKDKQETTAILNKWLANWQQQGVDKPKFVITTVSGGGLRSSLFTFRTMQMLDSVLNGQLMDHTRLITGSSGGLIGASYYRGLFIEQRNELLSTSGERYLDNISKDLLNTTMFSFIVSDLFMNTQHFTEGGNKYFKDRGYAFEKQMNENLGQVLNKKLSYYREPELSAEIPMMIISPTITNDGRALMISPVGISYMLQPPTTDLSSLQPIPDGIEYTRFLNENNPYNTSFSSILRMNATFPYIMPAISLPTTPGIEVMDAGIRDNYGVQNAIRFIYEFRTWIEENTSGIVFVQIRDTNKKSKLQNSNLTTLLNKLTSPVRNMSGNFILMQDYVQDDYLRYLESIVDCPLDFVQFQLPQMDDKIALSWHLTEKEKYFLKHAVYTPENKAALEKVHLLLNYGVVPKPIAEGRP